MTMQLHSHVIAVGIIANYIYVGWGKLHPLDHNSISVLSCVYIILIMIIFQSTLMSFLVLTKHIQL